jgi:flagellar capping protein FliD
MEQGKHRFAREAGEAGEVGEAGEEIAPSASSAPPAPPALSLPCLDSSNECVNQLTEKAIASSNKLKKLDEKIALIDQRLELMEDRIAYSQKKTWTNYVTLDKREAAAKPLRRW